MENQENTKGAQILNAKWYTDLGRKCNRCGRRPVGIILVFYPESKYFVAYIGVGDGDDEKSDKEFIRKWGTKLSGTEALAHFGKFETQLENKDGSIEYFNVLDNYKTN
jgi:hypothetical protein